MLLTMDNVLDGKRYALDDDFELAFTEERGRQRALIFLKDAPVSCAATGWAGSNKAVRRHARKLAEAIRDGKAPLVRLDRSERKAAEVALVTGPVPEDLRAVFDRVYGRGKWRIA